MAGLSHIHLIGNQLIRHESPPGVERNAANVWLDSAQQRTRRPEPVMHRRGREINASSSSLLRDDFPLVGLLDEVPDSLPVILCAPAKCPHAWVYSSVRWNQAALGLFFVFFCSCAQVWMGLNWFISFVLLLCEWWWEPNKLRALLHLINKW